MNKGSAYATLPDTPFGEAENEPALLPAGFCIPFPVCFGAEMVFECGRIVAMGLQGDTWFFVFLETWINGNSGSISVIINSVISNSITDNWVISNPVISKSVISYAVISNSLFLTSLCGSGCYWIVLLVEALC